MGIYYSIISKGVKMKQKILAKKHEKGQGLVEYVLTAILAGLVAAGAWMALGPEIKALAAGLIGATNNGGFSVNDGVVTIPNLSPTLTPTPIPSPTPTIPACTPGNAFNVSNKNACKSLRDLNNCDNFNYSSKKDTCSWH
jgi:hypothetical protein